jgi:osmotically-inducible protein OsmY
MMDILTEVANALYWDLAIPRHSVTVDVKGGWVTLHGVVERDYQKSCAEATVRRVPGVIGVKNEVAIRTARQSGHSMSPAQIGDAL